MNALAPSLKDVLAGERLGEVDPDECPEDWQPLEDEHEGVENPDEVLARKKGDPKLLDQWERLEVEAEVTTPRAGGHSNGSHGGALEVLGLGRSQDPQRRGPGDVQRSWVPRSVHLPDFSRVEAIGNQTEAEIGMIKRGVNMLLKASGDEERYWPQMARRIGERRGRLQLQALAATRPEAPMTSQGGALGVISQPIQSVLPGCPLSPPVECRVEAGFQLVFLS